jgi:hypothetical protein
LKSAVTPLPLTGIIYTPARQELQFEDRQSELVLLRAADPADRSLFAV